MGTGIVRSRIGGDWDHRTVRPTKQGECVRGQAQRLWQAHDQAQLRSAFTAGRARFGERVAAVVDSALTDYQRRWATAREDVCARVATGKWDDSASDRGMACLDEAFSHAEAVADTLRSAEVEVLQNAGELTRQLAAPENCVDLDYLRDVQPRPANARLRAEVAGLRLQLAPIRGMIDAGRYGRALEDTLELASAVDRAQFYPLTAELHHHLGEIYAGTADQARAVSHFRQSHEAAVAGGHAMLAAQAGLRLMLQVGYLGGQVAAGMAMSGQVRAQVARAGSPPDLRGRWLRNHGILLNLGQRYLGARANFIELIDHARENWGPFDLRTAQAMEDLAVTYGFMGRTEQAIELTRQYITVLEHAHGEIHPALVLAYQNHGAMLAQIGRDEEAVQRVAQALAVCEEVYGAAARACVWSMSATARIMQRLGRLRGAKALLERARAVQEQSGERGHPFDLWAHSHLAGWLLEAGRADEALELARSGLERLAREPFGQVLPTARADSWMMLARVQLRLADYDATTRALGQAQRALQRPGPTGRHALRSLQRMRAELALAQGDATQARALFSATRDATLDPGGAPTSASARSLAGLVRAQRALGQLDAALASSLDAESVLSDQHPPPPVFVARLLTERAGVLLAMGDDQGALDSIQRARALLERVDEPVYFEPELVELAARVE